MILIVLCALVILPSVAAPATSAGRTALIIGVGSYASPIVPTLHGIPHDITSAKLMAHAMGVPEQNIAVLRDEAATKKNILMALAELERRTPEGGRAFVYVSGHGTRWSDPQEGRCVEGFLSYDNQSIVNREFAEALTKLSQKADKVISILDACHSAGYAGVAPQSRSATSARLTPKFFYAARSQDDACSKPVNMLTRSLLNEVTRLGGLQENFVQIASARPDEVSFDDPEKGGLATQGLRECLLGRAKDVDRSGAVSLEEVRQCTQEIINARLAPYPDLNPHHVTIAGARNLIPVAMPLASSPANLPPPLEAPATPVGLGSAPTIPESPAAITTSPSADPPSGAPPTAEATPVLTSVVPESGQALASVSTLRDIEQQRNPRRRVQVRMAKSTLKVGKDTLELTVTSSHDGFVYLVLLGSDAKSFYVLFPNGLDKENRIRARQSVRLPRKNWQIQAAGPAGINNLLVMVTDSPRSFDALQMAAPSAQEPFTYALNDLPGRATLVDFLIGRGVDGRSETFGATLLQVREVP